MVVSSVCTVWQRVPRGWRGQGGYNRGRHRLTVVSTRALVTLLLSIAPTTARATTPHVR